MPDRPDWLQPDHPDAEKPVDHEYLLSGSVWLQDQGRLGEIPREALLASWRGHALSLMRQRNDATEQAEAHRRAGLHVARRLADAVKAIHQGRSGDAAEIVAVQAQALVDARAQTDDRGA